MILMHQVLGINLNQYLQCLMSDNKFDHWCDIQKDHPSLPDYELISTLDVDDYIFQSKCIQDPINQQNHSNSDIFSDIKLSEPKEYKQIDNILFSQNGVQNSKKYISTKKKDKNSNTIKKMGRIIQNRLKDYEIEGKVNTGVKKMMKKLRQRCGNKSNSLVDVFNTYHLHSLVDVKDQYISRFNLKTTRKIFKQQFRKDILKSHQIKTQAKKLVYLNTFKCSSLRFMSIKLARRLQNSKY